jgi:3-methyladenine DNA glycosylase AlkD
MLKIQEDFREYASKERSEKNLQFFKREDKNLPVFLGIMHSVINEFVQNYYKSFNIKDLSILINSQYHEERVLAIKLAIKIFDTNFESNSIRQEIFEIFYENIDCLNQWDLIDSSSIHIFGYFLNNTSSSYFIKLSNSLMWHHIRILLISQIKDIRKEQNFTLAFELCKKYFSNKEDLVQKAVGWVIKEAYSHCINKQFEIIKFIKENKNEMSKLTYRIANEKINF